MASPFPARVEKHLSRSHILMQYLYIIAAEDDPSRFPSSGPKAKKHAEPQQTAVCEGLLPNTRLSISAEHISIAPHGGNNARAIRAMGNRSIEKYLTILQVETHRLMVEQVLAELEACSFRNKTPIETSAHISPLLQKWLPLHSNTSSPTGSGDPALQAERRKDLYSHFILRLAFSATEDLRRRFTRIELMLFKLRFQTDDAAERKAFTASLNLGWDPVSDSERSDLAHDLLAATPGLKRSDLEEGGWFKVDFEHVPELVESRRVLVRDGRVYVPPREQISLVLAAFSANLEQGLEQASRALPRLDEDDRLTPILSHLSKNFATPDATLLDADTSVSGAHINAASIDALSQHFPLCMRNLHDNLRKNSHLKHFGRLQYTLFLKGIGLTLENCLIFWRQAFKLITDETFNKEYRYNVRHAYGDVGGDATRRGRGYTPYSCQKILTEHPPGAGESHGCPYRHFSIDNLKILLQSGGINDREVLQGVKEDVERKRYHIACNRVFEWSHHAELKRVKDEGSWPAAELDTIVHPNTYFKRSYMLKSSDGNSAQTPHHALSSPRE